jgi:hypothetical protein
MPVWKLQISWLKDTVAPRERMVITPHFNDIAAGSDPQNLCDDMLGGLQTIQPTTGEIKVTCYDAQGTVPVYPEAEAVANKGVTQATGAARELAMCLSFYGERNVPRQRGRLYIPLWFLGVTGASLRPTMPVAKMEALIPLFTDLGGVDVDWCVYSRRNDHAYSVTDWWYDNEWDIQRSRGGVGTSRIIGTTTEAGLLGTEAHLV